MSANEAIANPCCDVSRDGRHCAVCNRAVCDCTSVTFCDVCGYVACIHCATVAYNYERIKHCVWCNQTLCDGCATVTYCESCDRHMCDGCVRAAPCDGCALGGQ